MKEPNERIFGEIGRRDFLKGSLLGLLVLSNAGVLGSGCAATKAISPSTALKFFTPEEYTVMRAIAGRFIPSEGTDSPGAIELGVPETTDELLAAGSKDLQDNFRELLDAFENSTFLLGFKFGLFTEMSAEEQDKYIMNFMNSRLETKRTIYVALKKVVLSTYYADERAWKMISYKGPQV